MNRFTIFRLHHYTNLIKVLFIFYASGVVMPSPELKPNQVADKARENQILSGVRAGEVKPTPLKLPQLTAEEPVEPRTAPANENDTLLLRRGWERRRAALAQSSKDHLPGIIMFCGAGLSAMWLAAAVVYVHNSVGWQNITTLMPHEIGGFLAGLLTPVALFWMVLTFWLRSVDVKLYADALRHEIQAMIFPSEEAEKRVNNDIDRLMRQTAEMSRATRTAITTLQQARQAMHGETQAMKSGAEETVDRLGKLEEQLGTRTDKLELLQKQFDAKGQFLIDASTQLVQQAAKLDETVRQTSETSSVISQTLQAPIKNLEAWQGEVIRALDDSAAKIAERQDDLRIDVKAIEEKSQNLADTLQRGTRHLYDFTDDALDKAKLIETRLQGQGLALEQVLGEINTQADKLNAHHEHLLKQLQTNATEDRRQLVDNATLIESLLGQMNHARGALQDTIRGLGQTTTSSVEQLTLLGQRLQKELLQTAQFTEDSTKDNIETLAARTSGYVEQFGALVTAAAQRATELSQALLTDTRQALTNEQADVADVIAGLLDQNKTKMAETTLSFTALRDQVASLIDALSERQVALDKTGQSVTGTADAVHATLQYAFESVTATTSDLERGMAAMNTALEYPMQRLQQGIANAHDQAQVVGEIFDQKISGLTILGETLSEQAKTISQNLDSRAQHMQNAVSSINIDMISVRNVLNDHAQIMEDRVKAVMGQVTLVMPQIDTVSTQLTTLNTRVEQSGHTLSALDTTITTNGENLIRLSDTAVLNIQKNLASLDQSVSETSRTMAAAIDSSTDQIRRSMTGLTDTTMLDIQKSLVSLDQSVTESGRTIAALMDGTVEHVQRSIHGLTDTTMTNIQHSLASLDNSVAESGRNMTAVMSGLTDTTMVSIQQSLASLDRSVTESGQTMTALMDSTTDQIRRSMHGLTDTMDSSGKVVVALSEETVSHVQKSLERYAELGQLYQDVSKSSLESFTQAGDVYQQSLANLQDGTQKAVAGIAGVSDGYQAVTATMKSAETQLHVTRQAAETTTQSLTEMQQIMARTTGQLDAQTSASMRHMEQLQSTLNSAHEAFTQRASGLQDVAERAEQQAQDLMVRTRAINDASVANNNVLEKVTETLRQAMTQSGLQAQQVNDFNRYVAELNEQMSRQQNIVTDQATALERAALDAFEKAKTIRELDVALQRDHFFNAAKFVVESLHSLALDFTRMLDGELPEKTWRAYQRGETSIFARRLVSMRDSISHDKLRQKFAEDTEFRTYVQRYWRQFEEMHEQAKRHDHGDLLSSVFVSSDVGRLNQLLQDILKPAA
jgi:DNA repair exonuclease SbcCD ATPase subunit